MSTTACNCAVTCLHTFVQVDVVSGVLNRAIFKKIKFRGCHILDIDGIIKIKILLNLFPLLLYKLSCFGLFNGKLSNEDTLRKAYLLLRDKQ